MFCGFPNGVSRLPALAAIPSKIMILLTFILEDTPIMIVSGTIPRSATSFVRNAEIINTNRHRNNASCFSFLVWSVNFCPNDDSKPEIFSRFMTSIMRKKMNKNSRLEISRLSI
jgi:hypothetical protein